MKYSAESCTYTFNCDFPSLSFFSTQHALEFLPQLIDPGSSAWFLTSTQHVTCQYPIVSVEDRSMLDLDPNSGVPTNDPNTPFVVLEEMTTPEEVEAG